MLWIPGPTEVRAELLEVLARPQIGHRTPECVALMQRCLEGLVPLFATSKTVLFESCPATALMEAAIRNLVPRRSLHLTCGAFSERWAKIAEACGRETESRAVEWGEANTSAGLREKLETGAFDAVCVTHNETSTGVLNPLEEIAEVVRDFDDVLLLVDAVTSFAGLALDFDRRGIDLAFASSQKCLALPGGFCVYALSDAAMERAASAENRGWLLDFVRARDGLAAGKSVATPSIPHLYALEAQLESIHTEELENKFARYTAMAETTCAWARSRGLEMFAAGGFESPTVSCIRAGDLDVGALTKALLERGYRVCGGYGRLKGQTFRIGHMGDHRPAELDALLTCIDEVMPA